MFFVVFLFTALPSIVLCGNVICSSGELKNDGKPLDQFEVFDTSEKGKRRAACGWLLTVNESCTVVSMKARHLAFSSGTTLTKESCNLKDGFYCICSGRKCNEDVEKLHELLLASYKQLLARTITVGDPAPAEESLHCVLKSLRAEYQYSGSLLPEPKIVEGNISVLLDWINEHKNDKPNFATPEDDGNGNTVILVVVILVILLILISAAGGYYYWRRRKESLANESENEPNNETGETTGVGTRNETFPETCITDMSKLQSVKPQSSANLPLNMVGRSCASRPPIGTLMSVKAPTTGEKLNDTVHSSSPFSEGSTACDKGAARTKGIGGVESNAESPNEKKHETKDKGKHELAKAKAFEMRGDKKRKKWSSSKTFGMKTGDS